MPQCISAVAFPPCELDNQVLFLQEIKIITKAFLTYHLHWKEKSFKKLHTEVSIGGLLFSITGYSALRIWFVTERRHSFCGNLMFPLYATKNTTQKHLNNPFVMRYFGTGGIIVTDFQRHKEGSKADSWLEGTVWIKSHFLGMCLQVRWQVESTSGV